MPRDLDDARVAARALAEVMAALVRRSGTGRVLLGRAAGLIAPEGAPPWVGELAGELERAREEQSTPLEARWVERELRSAWGRPVGRVLNELDLAAPVAVTPLAQVHRGELDGGAVAVKLARPGLEAAVRADLMLLDALRPPLAAAFPNLDGGALLAQIRERALDELDFEHEASQQRAVARALRRTAGVEVPGGHSELATPAVVVSDFLDGPTLADGRPDDPAAVARALVAAHVDAARAGLLLCDPRPNHVVLRPDGRIGLLGTGAAVAGDRDWLRRRLALPAALRDADPAVFGAALAADGLLAEGRGAPPEAGTAPGGGDAPEAGIPSAAVAHRLLHETLGGLLTGPARLDGTALAGVADRAAERAGAGLAIATRARPEPADVWLLRGGGQLIAVLAGLGATEDWVTLLGRE